LRNNVSALSYGQDGSLLDGRRFFKVYAGYKSAFRPDDDIERRTVGIDASHQVLLQTQIVEG
jgi:hypothetical protein